MFVDRFIPPLWTLCDKYGIARIDLYSNYSYSCNEDNTTCITYIGYPNTRDDCPLEAGQNNYTNGTYVSIHRNEYEIMELLGHTLETHPNPNFDHTFIFGTQDTGEGVDRGALDWNQEVFTWLKHLPKPGKIIGCLSFSGAIDMRNFT